MDLARRYHIHPFQRAGENGDRGGKADPGGMSEAPEHVSEEATPWTVFPTGDGLAIACNGVAEFMRYCRSVYRVIPWPQAARARRLPGPAGNQATHKAGASCARQPMPD